MSEKQDRLNLSKVILSRGVREQLRQEILAHAKSADVRKTYRGLPALSCCLPIVISGEHGTGKSLLAQGIAGEVGQPTYLVDDASFDLEKAKGHVVVVDVGSAATGHLNERLNRLMQHDGILCLLVCAPATLRPAIWTRVQIHVSMVAPTRSMREQLWELHLPVDLPISDDIRIDVLGANFALNGAQVRNAVSYALMLAAGRDGELELTMSDLIAGAKKQLDLLGHLPGVRPSLRERASDVVLPEDIALAFEWVIGACKQRVERVQRPPVVVLIDGAAGTGKTFLAKVVAGECARPLVELNVAALAALSVHEAAEVMTKKVRIANRLQAILLVEGADSLFQAATTRAETLGNRLLDEARLGVSVVIMCTRNARFEENTLKRRLDFRISVPFPDVDQRAELWKRHLAGVKTDDTVDSRRLGQSFELSGGHIIKTIERAAYQASGSDLSMDHLIEAGISECQHCGTLYRVEGSSRPLSDRAKIIKVMPASVDDSLLQLRD